jgi:hypothetical protein
MNHSSLLLSASLIAISALGATIARPANACTAPACFHSQPYILPTTGAVPHNAPGFPLWFGGVVNGDPSKAVTLSKVDDAGASAVAVTTSTIDSSLELVTPATPLTVGQSYEMSATGRCTSGAKPDTTARFTVTDDAPLPTKLGSLIASAPSINPALAVTESGNCSEEIAASQTSLSIALDAEAAPWAELLVYSTEVDGKPWLASHGSNDDYSPAGSWNGHGTDVLYAACDRARPAALGLELGEHTVKMYATIVGTQINLATDAVTVKLTCGTTGGITDAGPPNAHTDNDAAVKPTPLGNDANDNNSTGGCAAAGSPDASPGLIAMGAAVIAFAIARARRRGVGGGRS